MLSVRKYLSKAGDYIVGETCCRAGDDRKVFIRMPNKYCHILLEIEKSSCLVRRKNFKSYI